MLYVTCFVSVKKKRQIYFLPKGLDKTKQKGETMHELINIKNEEAVTTSLLVAEVFGKQHRNVLRSIDGLLKNEQSKKMFVKGTYLNTQGHKQPMYYLNRDGFSLLVMGFTGEKALEWKFKYIEAFNKMEKYINFRKADVQIQKNSMQFLCDNLEMPTPKDYIKANTIADKCVSNIYGYPKMVKKKDMSAEMLEAREPILRDTVEFMAFKDKYDLDTPVSEAIYRKFG